MADWQDDEDLVIYSEMSWTDKPFFRGLKKFMAFIFVLIFLGACFWQIHSLRLEGQALDATIEDLQNQIEEEKVKELQIKVDKEYYQSMLYKEQMARNRCRLIYPGEVLITILQK